MACELGLSVHTVNERLRDARRKLSATSSREAARLLRDAEGDAPQLVVDKVLGDAAADPDRAQSGVSTAEPQKRRRAVWITGVIAMLLIAVTVFAFSPVAQTPSAPSSAVSVKAESAAAQSARRWLALVDAFDWKASYDTTGVQFRELNTLAVWTSASQKVRVPLGAVVSRTLISEEFTPTPPAGAQLVKFRTRYASRAEAVETLSLVDEGGVWRVVGCFIE